MKKRQRPFDSSLKTEMDSVKRVTKVVEPAGAAKWKSCEKRSKNDIWNNKSNRETEDHIL